MKKYFLLLFSLLALVPSNVIAQQKKAAYIFRNDNAFDAFACKDVDSITYDKVDEREYQVVWTEDSIYKIPLENIDSVCFNTPKNIIFQIPEEDLNGWDVGYSLGDEYIVAYTDESDSSLVMMINKNGREAEDGLIVRLNESNEIVGIGNLDKLYDVRYEGNNIVLYRFNEDSLYEEAVIPVSNLSKGRTIVRKMPSLEAVGQAILQIIDFISNIQSGVSMVTDVMKEDWKGLGIETGWLLVGIKVNPLTGAILTYAQSAIDHYLHQDQERKRAVLYDNCEIEIDEVKSENGSRVVYATVKNANNLPDYVFRAMYDHEFNETTRNLVSCGVVVRARKKNVTTHLYDYKSQVTPLNGDGAAGAEVYLSFTIPELDDAPNFESYYLRPYLTSTRLRSSGGDVNEGYIKYGETYEYTCPTVEIDTIAQKSCKHYESTSDYLVEASIDATIEDVKYVTEWGVAIYTRDNGELLGEVTTSPDKMEYTFKYQGFLDESYFDTKSKSIKLRAIPFAEGRSKNDRAYGKAKDFEVEESLTSCPDANHPHMIDLGLPSGTKWACCNVGATAPEQYGGYYAWGEVNEKDYYAPHTYQYAYKDNNGDWCDYDTQSYYSCRSLGSDIAGTQYDVAHVQWGGSWVMPSHAQLQELLDYCTSTWTTENGVYGSRFTGQGPDGGSIFLPAAGYRWYGYLDYAGSDGYYWSSTQDPSGSGFAYGLYFSSGDAYWNYGYGYCLGRSVRPVVKN
ncbi:MAG: hypothetical protein IJK42_09490 [Prevotella sp.]|nr:hypothetical protein [Prevotella sp.]